MKANQPFEIKADTIVTVCGHCFPKSTIFAAYPILVGFNLSHGICPKHKIEMLAQLRLDLARSI